MDLLIDVFGFTNSGSKVKIGQIAKRLSSIGGTVFYVNQLATGANYSFYDSNGDEVIVDDTDLTTFANVAYYIKSGIGSADRYYVYDSIGGAVSGKPWGYMGIKTNASQTAIGTGKTNTNTILSITDTSEYAADSIFVYIKNRRDNIANGCDDWYLGSPDELDQLFNYGFTIPNSKYFRSSREINRDQSSASRRGTSWGNWEMRSKASNTNDYFVPIRSF